MKTYKRYIEITPKEALLALAENDGKPVDGFAFRLNKHGAWKSSTLNDFDFNDHDLPFGTKELGWMSYVARVIEVNPRDVPEGCTPLPEDKPWLAYVGIGKDVPNDGEYYCLQKDLRKYTRWLGGFMNNGDLTANQSCHYAIDVRTDFAKQHFPEIVEAMEYEEPDPCLEAWKKVCEQDSMSKIIHRKFKQGWDAAIKHMEANK